MKIILKSLILFIIFASITGIIFYASEKYLGFNQLDFLKEKLNLKLNKEDGNETHETKPLEAQADTSKKTILEASANIVIQTNQEVSVKQTNRIDLAFVKNKEEKFYYVAKISNIGIGPSTVKITLTSKSGEELNIEIPFERNAFNLPFGMTEIEPWANAEFEVNGDNLLANVNKTGRLTIDYVPKNLVDLNKDYLLYTNTPGILLKKEAADYLKLMLNDLAKATNKNVVIASGYRSYNDQVETYTGWLKSNGQEEADKVSARPGFSEHQLGTAVDFINEDSGFDFISEFDQTTAGKWIKENAYKYGFVQSYPKDKENLTGYSYEAWHYRYIGVENAKDVKEKGVTLKEYISNQ